MTRSKIPTILAILILLIGLAALLFAKNQIQQLRSGAQTSLSPQNLKITNIKNNSFTVSWLTDSPTIGFVEYQNSDGTINKSSPTSLSTTHFVLIQNLNPATPYSFKINSGGQYFDNGGLDWKIVTASSQELINNPSVVSGQIMTQSGFPAKNALVYVSGAGFDTASALVSASGNWIISLPPLPDTTILEISVDYSGNVQTTAEVDLKEANPVPTITLGNSYNFTGNGNKNDSQDAKPNTSITLP